MTPKGSWVVEGGRPRRWRALCRPADAVGRDTSRSHRQTQGDDQQQPQLGDRAEPARWRLCRRYAQPQMGRRHQLCLDVRRAGRHKGWLYLAVILDLHSRRVVGWAVSDRIKQDLAIRALDMAANLRQPPEGCIFHSDRGSQYCAYDYQKRLQRYGLKPSMSGKGQLLR